MSIEDQIVITGALGEYQGRRFLYLHSEITDDGKEFVHGVFQADVKRLPVDGLVVYAKPKEDWQ